LEDSQRTKKKEYLGDKARKGLSWSLFGNLIKQILNISVSIVIARILGPEDYGVVAIASIFVAFSQIFVDVGFTDGIIQKLDVNKLAISSVFYFNLFISIILGLSIYFLAPAIGDFFDSTDVVGVIQLIMLVLPISALGKIHSAILTKELEIKALTIRDIISSFVGGAVGLWLAFSGFGVWSLVWQQISAAISGTLLLWFGSNFIPLFAFSWKELKGLLAFSYFVFMDSLMQQVFNKLDTVFVGKMFSPTILGLYNRASTLGTLINDLSTKSLMKVVFPVFSVLQNDREKITDIFVKFMCFIIVVTTTLVGIMFFSSEAIIIGLLGEKWRLSIEFFQILAFSTISLPLRAIVFKAILGLGYSKMKFRLSLINNFIKIASIPFGYFFGIEAFAWSVVIGRFLIVAISWIAFNNLMKINLFQILTPIALPISVLIFWSALYYSGLVEINMLYYVPMFLFTHIGLMILTKNYGFVLLMQETAKVKNKVFSKFIKQPK
jgi:O-antigen/teichoic acid export membrane protein